MNTLDQATDEEFSALAGFYQLLQRLWLSEIDAPLLAELRDGALADLARELEIPVNEGPAEVVLEDLAVAYCQLLIGPANHVPPYQSVWTEGQFQSAATTSMQSYLEVVGEQPSDSSMVDHLGVQLSVMRRIVAELATCPSDTPRHHELHTMARQFYHDHLSWPTKFLARAQQATDSAFYQGVARITAVFLDQEREYWSTPEQDPENPG